jgi:predicted RNA binding protein YcfA (HicA-like mRNA interferase family)
MKIPRCVSGAHFADVLCRRWGYAKVNQVGSHIVLETSQPGHQRIAVPDHSPLRLGTFNSLLRMIARHKGVTRDAIIATL